VRTKRAKILLAGALIGATVFVGAAPASAQPADLPCEVFKDPYGYPCGVAEGALIFVDETLSGLWPFVEQVGDEADEAVDNAYHLVSCTVNPDDPEC
jgi:hypothetical protein